MEVIDSFNSIFDLTQITSVDNIWEVNESHNCASFRKLNIHNIGEVFNFFDSRCYKGTKCISEMISSSIKDKDCDGVAFTTFNGSAYIILSELKSALDSGDILKAYTQTVFTLIKLHMILSLCKGYDIESMNILSIIACQPPKDAKQLTYLKDQMLLMEEGGKLGSDVKLLLNLFFKKKIDTLIKDVSFIKDLPLNEQLANKNIRFCLKTADEYGNESVDVELKDLLR